MKNYKTQKGSVVISILILFALVFSTAFYISKDLIDFKKNQVRYELLSSRDLLIEQMKQYMYNPVVMGVTAVLMSEDTSAGSTRFNFRKCIDSVYDNTFPAGERCAALLCSKNDASCVGKPTSRPLKSYSPIARSGNLSVSKICTEANFGTCDYLNITGTDASTPVKYRADGSPCLEATPGTDCVFWFYAEFICDNKFKGAGNESVPCHAENKNIFVNVTMMHATAFPRSNSSGGTDPATVATASLIDKNRINTEDIRLTYIPVSEVENSRLYLCQNSPAPDCDAGAGDNLTNGTKPDGCPCNKDKATSCPALVCGSPAAALPINKCCGCTCPAASTIICGSEPPGTLGCPCTNPRASTCNPAILCSDSSYKAGCPCVNNGVVCDPNLSCSDSSYQAGCPCKAATVPACSDPALLCNDPMVTKGCPCTEVGTCPAVKLSCDDPLLDPQCGCTCPSNLETASAAALALPGCPSIAATATVPAAMACPATPPLCSSAAALLKPGCPCANNTPPTTCSPVDCGSMGDTKPGCNCTQPSSCPMPQNVCGTAAADALPGCSPSCPTGLICGTLAANALPGCACKCPGTTPTCGYNSGTGTYNISPVPGCPCSPPPPPPPPPPSGS